MTGLPGRLGPVSPASLVTDGRLTRRVAGAETGGHRRHITCFRPARRS